MPVSLLTQTFLEWLWERLDDAEMRLAEKDPMAQLAKEMASRSGSAPAFPPPHRVPKKRSHAGAAAGAAERKKRDTILVRDLTEVGVWHIDEKLRRFHPYYSALELGDVQTMRALTSLMATSIV